MTILYSLQRLKMVWLTINIYISTIIVATEGTTSRMFTCGKLSRNAVN